MAKTTTIMDIAEKAGVSKSTVSAVINGRKGWASKQTRNRVLQVIKEHDYRPSAIARSLRVKQTQTIGMLFPACEIASEVAIRQFANIERVLSQSGYSVLISHSRNNSGANETCLAEFLNRQVDGLVIAPENLENTEKLQELVAEGFPVVTVDSRLGFLTDNVSIDRAYGAEQVIEHLLSIGRTRIAFLLGNITCPTIQERIVGYRRGCERAGLPFESLKMITREFCDSYAGGEQMCRELLDSCYPFDAVIGSNDMVALGIMNVLTKAGRRIPEDVGVVGFDDVMVAKVLPIPLTTVHQPTEIGQTVSDFLLSRIDNNKCEFRSIVLRPELVIRESTVPNMR